MEVRTAGDAVKALVSALQLRFGDVLIRVSDGRATIIRQGTTFKLEDLDGYFVPEPDVTQLREAPEGAEL